MLDVPTNFVWIYHAGRQRAAVRPQSRAIVPNRFRTAADATEPTKPTGQQTLQPPPRGRFDANFLVEPSEFG